MSLLWKETTMEIQSHNEISHSKTKAEGVEMIEELWMCAVAQGYCNKYGSISIEVFMDLLDINLVQKWGDINAKSKIN